MPKRSIILVGLSTAVAGIAALAIVFPHVSRPGLMRGKPSQSTTAAQHSLANAREKDLISPIYAAMKADKLSSVEDGWKKLVTSPIYLEDPVLRLALARYLIGKGKVVEAHDHLDKILHPPVGNSSTLQHSGEVMSLWLQTSGKETPAKIAQTKVDWDGAAAPFAKTENGIGDPTGMAKVEYLAAQELEAQTKPAEALTHYEKAVKLQPGSTFLWSALGQARLRAGDFKGSKEAMARAYWTAKPEDRQKIQMYNGLSKSDINRMKP
jgi:tetratricopeptide (TPR) repeat protein